MNTKGAVYVSSQIKSEPVEVDLIVWGCVVLNFSYLSAADKPGGFSYFIGWIIIGAVIRLQLPAGLITLKSVLFWSAWIVFWAHKG